MLGPLLARTVITASSLRIFDALKDGPRTTAEISAPCGTDVTATDKLLRGLYGSKYLTWRRGRYKLTRMSGTQRIASTATNHDALTSLLQNARGKKAGRRVTVFTNHR